MPQAEHLQMIQAAIDRLAGQSSSLKGWAVTIVAALLSVATADADRTFALIAVYVLIALALLDAYYLALERSYRDLYEEAVAGRAAAWQMRAGPVGWGDVASALASPSVCVLHGISLVATIVVLAATA